MSNYYGHNQGPPGPGHQYPSQGYPQQPYGPPMNQGYQQGWNPPPQGYPPQGSPYPPQGGPYGPPPGQNWQQGPPPPHGHQQWQSGPPPGPQQWQQGPPPPQGGQQWQQGPPPPGGQQWQQGPPGNYGQPGGPPIDALATARALRSAMKGMGTDENALIRNLAHLTPDQVVAVKTKFREDTKGRDLMKDIHSETSGYFREGLEAIVRGPLEQDCHVVHQAIKGLGTKESALNDVLLGRSNGEINALKQHYHHMYGHSLESDVKGDLSLKTERLFDMVLSARRNDEGAPVIPQQTEQDVRELYHATEGRSGTDQLSVCQIMTSRSDGQLRAIAQQYQQTYRRSLNEVFRKEFSGHMQDALIFLLTKAEDPAKHDVDQLEACMKGAGTKDQALVRRIIAVHWNPERLRQCKAAYKHFYHRDLAQTIKSETSGDYERLMVACISEQQQQPNYRPY